MSGISTASGPRGSDRRARISRARIATLKRRPRPTCPSWRGRRHARQAKRLRGGRERESRLHRRSHRRRYSCPRARDAQAGALPSRDRRRDGSPAFGAGGADRARQAPRARCRERDSRAHASEAVVRAQRRVERQVEVLQRFGLGDTGAQHDLDGAERDAALGAGVQPPAGAAVPAVARVGVEVHAVVVAVLDVRQPGAAVAGLRDREPAPPVVTRQQHEVRAQRGAAVDAVFGPGHLERELRRQIEPADRHQADLRSDPERVVAGIRLRDQQGRLRERHQRPVDRVEAQPGRIAERRHEARLQPGLGGDGLLARLEPRERLRVRGPRRGRQRREQRERPQQRHHATADHHRTSAR